MLYQPGWIFQVDLVYLISLGIFLTWIYSRIKPVLGVLSCITVAASQFFVTQWIFVNKGFWITAVFPFLENILIFGSLAIYWYLTEEKQKNFIHDTFGKYLSPKVVDKLLKDPSKLQLGGEQKELTALFTNLARFTTFSEKLSAQELVHLLNDYFTEMNETSHINGIENFWGIAKMRLAKFRGLSKSTFYLHLKECEFRFNHRNQSLYKLLLKIIKKRPLTNQSNK